MKKTSSAKTNAVAIDLSKPAAIHENVELWHASHIANNKEVF
jgi:hypothetical protein